MQARYNILGAGERVQLLRCCHAWTMVYYHIRAKKGEWALGSTECAQTSPKYAKFWLRPSSQPLHPLLSLFAWIKPIGWVPNTKLTNAATWALGSCMKLCSAQCVSAASLFSWQFSGCSHFDSWKPGGTVCSLEFTAHSFLFWGTNLSFLLGKHHYASGSSPGILPHISSLVSHFQAHFFSFSPHLWLCFSCTAWQNEKNPITRKHKNKSSEIINPTNVY